MPQDFINQSPPDVYVYNGKIVGFIAGYSFYQKDRGTKTNIAIFSKYDTQFNNVRYYSGDTPN